MDIDLREFNLYEIRLCKAEEINLLTNFLKNSWSEKHIFLKNKDVLNFQHKTLDGYNFVVAYHSETNCFHGILGVISQDFFVDRKIGKRQHVWLAIWKVDKELAKSNSLGIDMLTYLETKFSPVSISAIGINNTVSLLYKLMGFQIKTMNQWFIPNRNIGEPKLIVGDLPETQYQSLHTSNLVVECGIEHKSEIQHFLLNSKARRSFSYIVQRYLKHPFHTYSVYAFKKKKSAIFAIAIGRKVSANGVSAFRLTELFFDLDHSSDLGLSLNQLIVHKGYEYIDFLEFGYDPESLAKVGFIRCSEQLFVPHLFEPFVADRSEVKIAFKSTEPFICTKGDSDLDRPNIE